MTWALTFANSRMSLKTANLNYRKNLILIDICSVIKQQHSKLSPHVGFFWGPDCVRVPEEKKPT